MRVVLCQAVHRGDEREVGLEPLGLAYLSSYVHAHLPKTEFFYAESVDEILSRDPEFVGISAVSQNCDVANRLASELRGSGYTGPLVLGGVHISALPTSLSSEFDAGAIGEGEQTMLELVRLVGEDRSAWRERRESISGICFRSNGEVVMTPAREQVRPLDRIPPPDRDLLSEMWPTVRGGEHRLFTSRGCPYDCDFCSSSQFWKTVRYFSAEYALREMSDLVERFRPKRLLIHDDLFIANRNRFRAIAEGVVALGLADEVEYVCNLRADRVDTETCELLKRMNTTWVTLGVESASDRVLALMNKRTNVRQILGALHLLQRYGIEVETCFMLGYPGETVEDIKKTVDFIEDNFGTLFRDYSLFPVVLFPGTRIWKDAVRDGLIDENFDPRSINRSTNNFNPDRYIFLNSHVPRDTFLYYFYYLRFLTVRQRLRRSSSYLREADKFQGKLLDQIDAMGLEMDQASRHLAKLEEELSHEKERIAMLEQGRQDQKNSPKRFFPRGSGR